MPWAARVASRAASSSLRSGCRAEVRRLRWPARRHRTGTGCPAGTPTRPAAAARSPTSRDAALQQGAEQPVGGPTVRRAAECRRERAPGERVVAPERRGDGDRARRPGRTRSGAAGSRPRAPSGAASMPSHAERHRRVLSRPGRRGTRARAPSRPARPRGRRGSRRDAPSHRADARRAAGPTLPSDDGDPEVPCAVRPLDPSELERRPAGDVRRRSEGEQRRSDHLRVREVVRARTYTPMKTRRTMPRRVSVAISRLE